MVKPSRDPTLNIAQIKFAFKDLKAFKCHLEDGSKLLKVFEQLKDVEGNIPLSRALTLGVILCEGTLLNKADVLYRVLQDQN